jgi:hypothetical protein
VTGNLGVIFRTTDGGANWEPQTSGTTDGLYSIHFINENTGWMAGAFGLILHTTDGGSNWDLQNNMSVTWLGSIFFIDENNGWTAGSFGLILHTNSGGISNIRTEEMTCLPEDFRVYQNYPNPFNPSTNIRYSISKSTFVKLTVFDVLGNEVTTLVDEDKQPGNYNVEFRMNSSEYSSGVYFYQLIVEPFSQTKKMVLLR